MPLVVGLCTVGLLAILLPAVWIERSKPDLELWHLIRLESEFHAGKATRNFDWYQYLALEDELFAELDQRVVRTGPSTGDPSWSRYAAGGVNNPSTFPHNWNRSYEMKAASPTGGALMLHGLTDSPYSLRRPAEILNAHGLYVVGPRLPGHGTTPSMLARARVDDWRAAVRVAYRHLQQEVGPDAPLVVVGYSNGGALALDLVLDSLADPSVPTPDRVVLFSPAIGIMKAAALARTHHVLSWMPWFRKLGWQTIEPEFDPFKYNSFPTDAGYQTHVLTRSLRHRIARLDEASRRAFPPVLGFISLADATVLVEAVVDGLYDRLDNPDNELVIFDINRQAKMLGFFRADPAERLQSLVERRSTPYRLTVLTNGDGATNRLQLWSRRAGSEKIGITDLGLQWPRGFYSLSHVALPFPPDDPIYGTEPDPENLFGVQLGTLEPRGEKGLLDVPSDQLTRLRCNPFFPYVEQRLVEITR